MKWIPPIPPVNPPKEDKIVNRVAWPNPKTYDGKYDSVELEDWIRGMEKIFTVFEVPKERKVYINTFYLTGEVDIWCNTLKDRLNRPALA